MRWMRLFHSSLCDRAREALVRRISPSPVRARHAFRSMVFSEDDAISQPSERLLNLSIQAIAAAHHIELNEICCRLRGRFPFPDQLPNLWPGEHYRLLAGFVQVLRPVRVVEIGTAEGMSALALRKYLPANGKVVSFDIVPWHEYPRSCLKSRDFDGAELQQIVADVSRRETLEENQELFSTADLIFIDAAKNGFLEPYLLSWFGRLQFRSRPIFVLDDIRLWNMLAVWRALNWPKLDVTSFGHWCGTGICERST